MLMGVKTSRIPVPELLPICRVPAEMVANVDGEKLSPPVGDISILIVRAGSVGANVTVPAAVRGAAAVRLMLSANREISPAGAETAVPEGMVIVPLFVEAPRAVSAMEPFGLDSV